MMSTLMQNVSRGVTGAMEETNLADFKVLALHLHAVSVSFVCGIFGNFQLFVIALKRCRLGCDFILNRAETQVQLCFDEFRFL